MLFVTQKFLIFYVVVFTIYWSIPWKRPRVWLLLVASYYFYFCFNQWLALLVAGSSVIDYLIAHGMNATSRPLLRRLLLILSLVMNLGLLCYFKYENFFLETYFQSIGFDYDRKTELLDIILPIGISFYTFEAINYTVDVFREKIRPERNLDYFLLFILFFPHLVAGPIVRASDFLPQVARHKHLTWTRFAVGGRQVVLGLFKKMVIADRMALLVDPVFANPAKFDTGVVWMAAIAYAIQIYCDFSGYSDIALGTARALGYRLMVNFEMPYASTNITEFWRRWHISLSTWIRDYIYIPLGGNRGSVLRSNVNVLITFTLCGLWHGANWTFVVWGALNGIYLILHRAFRWATRDLLAFRAALDTIPGIALRIAMTFTATTLAFVVFRAPTFAIAKQVFHQMFVPTAGEGWPVPPITIWTFALIVLAAHLLGSRPALWQRWQQQSPAVRGVALASIVFATLIFAPVTTWTFIYFQF
ncbi:MAG TPA: MBOAT family O-acyltransferase [Gemmataceae bacterium]|jgi:alginate O-acetyltransferase complex protein AlgI|nr:MBOAT family O-acyltransferase [Gemmataceae bacterium]